jgi:hypothetical protein
VDHEITRSKNGDFQLSVVSREVKMRSGEDCWRIGALGSGEVWGAEPVKFCPNRTIFANILFRGEVEKWKSGEVRDKGYQVLSESVNLCQYPNHRSAELTPKPPKSNNPPKPSSFPQRLHRVYRLPPRPVQYLVPAACAGCGYDDIIAGISHCREEHELSDLHAHLIVFLFVAE